MSTNYAEDPHLRKSILEFLALNGWITRSDAAKLCKIKPNQATYLLMKMAREGAILFVGRGRNAHYELPEPK